MCSSVPAHRSTTARRRLTFLAASAAACRLLTSSTLGFLPAILSAARRLNPCDDEEAARRVPVVVDMRTPLSGRIDRVSDCFSLPPPGASEPSRELAAVDCCCLKRMIRVALSLSFG